MTNLRTDMQTYHAPRRGPSALAFGAVAGGALAAWAWWRPFRVAVEGQSMRPTFDPDDLLLVTVRGRVRPGSVVVVERPDRPGFELVKRVARCTEQGYWVVGDDPGASTDSRSFGAVDREAIRGVVRLRYRPRPGPVRRRLR